VDTNLGATAKPFEAQFTGNLTLDLSLNALITITAMPKPMDRGRRSS
jgi:hypothetical protein